MEPQNHFSSIGDRHDTDPYWKLLFMLILSFISMDILMYAMVNSLENVFSNITLTSFIWRH